MLRLEEPEEWASLFLSIHLGTTLGALTQTSSSTTSQIETLYEYSLSQKSTLYDYYHYTHYNHLLYLIL